MNILHALLGEHGPIRHQLDVLRLQAPQLDDHLLRAAVFGLAEAIESHARIEDELLFDPLATSGRMPTGPVEAMRSEHREIESLFGQVLAPATPTESPDLQRTVARLIELVRHHFDHEEHVLFPFAAAALDETRLDELGRTWGERRSVMLRNFTSAETQAFGMRR
jgi:hemerythrin-like domain-containing protein